MIGRMLRPAVMNEGERPCREGRMRRPANGPRGLVVSVGRQRATKPCHQVDSEDRSQGDGSAPRDSSSCGKESGKPATALPQPRQQLWE